MREDEFKLKDDDTMRRLRIIAQAPGELQWRLELVSTLERMRVTQEISARVIIQSQGRLRKEMAHLTPTKLAELMNAQIDQWEKNKDSARLRSGRKQLLGYLFAIAASIAGTVIAYKLSGR